MFVLDPSGVGLLFKLALGQTWLDVAWITLTAFFGIAALSGGVQNYLLQKTSTIERVMLILAGLLLVYPKPLFDFIGIGLLLIVLGAQWLRGKKIPI